MLQSQDIYGLGPLIASDEIKYFCFRRYHYLTCLLRPNEFPSFLKDRVGNDNIAVFILHSCQKLLCLKHEINVEVWPSEKMGSESMMIGIRGRG